MSKDKQTERVEKVAWAIADVIANRRCDGKAAINDQRRAEARAAIAAMKEAGMDRLVAEGQQCDAIAKARNDALREAADAVVAHRYPMPDEFLNSCRLREKHREDISASILALIKEPTP